MSVEMPTRILTVPRTMVCIKEYEDFVFIFFICYLYTISS